MIRRNVRIGERPLAPARFPDIRPLEPAVGSFSASQAVPFVALWNWLARRPVEAVGVVAIVVWSTYVGVLVTSACVGGTVKACCADGNLRMVIHERLSH